MNKKAFSLVKDFIKHNLALVLGMVALMLLITTGEQKLSDTLVAANLDYVDYALGIVRMILQSALSTILVYTWYKQKNQAAPFATVDILKLFVSTFVTTIAVTFCVVLIVLIPLGIWLYLRWDFFMNAYITGKSNGIFSCIGYSMRKTKGFAGKYLAYNIRYLLFYFLIEAALMAFVMTESRLELPSAVLTAVDVIDILFMSVFMPYRFLVKCGFYDVFLLEEKHNG